MTILTTFLQYAVKFVMFAAVALAGIFLGKKLRDSKDAKTQKSRNRQLEESCSEEVWSE